MRFSHLHKYWSIWNISWNATREDLISEYWRIIIDIKYMDLSYEYKNIKISNIYFSFKNEKFDFHLHIENSVSFVTKGGLRYTIL